MKETRAHESSGADNQIADLEPIKKILISLGFYEKSYEQGTMYLYNITPKKQLGMHINDRTRGYTILLHQTIYTDEYMDNQSFKQVIKTLLQPYNCWENDFDSLNIGSNQEGLIVVEEQKQFLKWIGWEPSTSHYKDLVLCIYKDVFLTATFDDFMQRFCITDHLLVGTDHLANLDDFKRLVEVVLRRNTNKSTNNNVGEINLNILNGE